MDIKPIRGEADYERALRRVEEFWNASEGSTEGDELDILATLIEAYEREHYPIDLPVPIEAIKFRLEQKGKDSRHGSGSSANERVFMESCRARGLCH